ncbi:MAG: histone deacetylase [Candidatus Micrarchaeota archaeon]
MKIAYSERFLYHYMGQGHPESAKRLDVVMDALKKNSKLKVEIVEPARLEEKDLLLAHEKKFIQSLKLLSAREAMFVDNPFHRDTFEIAKLAAGGAVRAARECFGGEASKFSQRSCECFGSGKFSFALVRPPGHHAGRNFFGGFCYLNNIAIAIRKIQQEKKIKRALIVDFDVHHGNGTQNIFREDEDVFYFSLHQHPATIFPGTGFASENSAHIRNVPLEPGTTDREYLRVFKENFEEIARAFKPQIIGVSAGFDTYVEDIACGNQLLISKKETHHGIGKIIRRGARRARCPVFAVLEGGYHLPTLGKNVMSFLSAF